jgi:translation initiation factor IF-3
MDLVEVAPTARPPVCKIMDYGKWRYQQQKKEDKSRASSKGGRLKMLNIDTIRIGDHDLQIKMNHARDFLKEGNKVQFTLRFKGREMAHLDLGRDLMNKVKTELWSVSKVERDAKMEGRRMTLVLQPDHKAPGAKMPQPQAGTAPGVGAGRGPSPMGAGAGLNLQRPPAGGPVGPGPPGRVPWRRPHRGPLRLRPRRPGRHPRPCSGNPGSVGICCREEASHSPADGGPGRLALRGSRF